MVWCLMATSLVAKLQLKPGHRLIVRNAPRGKRAQLTSGLTGVKITTSGEADAVLLFVNDLSEAEALTPDALDSVREGGLVWLAYPKGTSPVRTDVNRDTLRASVETLGWATVRLVAIDETWSALRVRPQAEVGR